MSNVLLRLRELSGSFSNTERGVAKSILEDPRQVVDMSIHELAKHTFSSPSTIVRLCNHTGYSGYKEFRKALTYELARRDDNIRIDQKAIGASDTLAEIVDKITYQNIISLQETKELLDLEAIRASVDILSRAKVIYLFGMGASLCAAKDAYLKFLRLNKPAMINEDWHAQLIQARNASPEDAALVISYSGATVEMIECMKELKAHNTPIIAITRCVQSPVADLADQKLYTSANESLFRSGAMASRISQLNIVDILYTALANQSYEASMNQLSRTHIRKPEIPGSKSQRN